MDSFRSDGRSGPGLDRPLALRLLAVIGGSVLAGVTSGIAVGFLLVLMVVSTDRSDDPWASLGAALLALFVGVLAGGATFIAAAAVGIRRVVGEGRRLRTIAAVVGSPVALYAGIAVIGPAATGGLTTFLTAVAALSLVVLIVTAVLAAAGALHRPAPVRVASISLGVAVLSVAGAVVLGPTAERGAIRDAYERLGLPLALVDGVRLDVPVAGWHVHEVRHPRYSEVAEVTWAVPGRSVDARVTLSFVRAPRVPDCQTNVGQTPNRGQSECHQIGTRSDGAPIWASGQSLVGGLRMAWVDRPDGGRWLVTGYPPGSLTTPDAVEVLNRLEPVTVDRYVDVATRR